MAEKHLSEGAQAAGQRLLSALDDAGLKPEAAGWLYAHSIEEWRYIVVTSAVDEVGRRRIYGALIDLFRAIDFGPDLTDADVHLVSPSEWWYAAMKAAVRVGGGAVQFTDCVFNGIRVDGVIYRLGVPAPAETAKRRSEVFAKTAKRMAEHVA